MAKCQSVDIRTQYERFGVRCFDLRIRYKDDCVQVAHGAMVYDISGAELVSQLRWMNEKGDCYVRLIHEVRTRKQYTEKAVENFRSACEAVERNYPNIRFWCGRNLYNWQKDYDFGKDPTCYEDYSSVSKPRWIDDWWPWLYAKFHNRKILAKGTDCEILLMDYVNIR